MKEQVNVANKGGNDGDNKGLQPMERSEEIKIKKQKTASEEVEDMVRELERNNDLDGTPSPSSTKAENKDKKAYHRSY